MQASQAKLTIPENITFLLFGCFCCDVRCVIYELAGWYTRMPTMTRILWQPKSVFLCLSQCVCVCLTLICCVRVCGYIAQNKVEPCQWYKIFSSFVAYLLVGRFVCVGASPMAALLRKRLCVVHALSVSRFMWSVNWLLHQLFLCILLHLL